MVSPFSVTSPYITSNPSGKSSNTFTFILQPPSLKFSSLERLFASMVFRFQNRLHDLTEELAERGEHPIDFTKIV